MAIRFSKKYVVLIVFLSVLLVGTIWYNGRKESATFTINGTGIDVPDHVISAAAQQFGGAINGMAMNTSIITPTPVGKL